MKKEDTLSWLDADVVGLCDNVKFCSACNTFNTAGQRLLYVSKGENVLNKILIYHCSQSLQGGDQLLEFSVFWLTRPALDGNRV